MENFKDFYNNHNGKMILFFGFYIIFFIFVSLAIKSENPKNVDVNNSQVEEKITTYNITNLTSNDYEYDIKIIDNDETITFHGTKSNVDYANYPNKYFLDIYNINQLLKKSKFIDSKDYVLSYELENNSINEILLTNKENNVNKIDVSVNKKGEVEKIVMNLSKYMEKDKYEITINYTVGENNENSIS